MFVHLGRRVPTGLVAALQQAIAWHGAGAVTLITDNPTKVEGMSGVDIVDACELRSALVGSFRSVSGHDARFRDGFWRSTAERLFVLQAYMESRELSEILHLENDNLSFVDQKIEERLRALPAGVCVPFVSQGRGVGSILYASGSDEFNAILKNFLGNLSQNNTLIEMELFALAKSDGLPVHALPTAPSECWVKQSSYSADHPVVSQTVQWENFSHFGCLFDGSAVGHYLAGQDPANDRYVQRNRYRNQEVDLDVTEKQWMIREEESGYLELWLGDGAGAYKMANLHMHCKEFVPLSPSTLREYQRMATACELNDSLTSVQWIRMVRDLRFDLRTSYDLAYQLQYWARSRR